MLSTLNTIDPLYRAVTVGDLRSYLLRTGWQIKPFPKAGVIYFEGPRADDGTPLVQIVPASGHYRDFPLHVEEIVSALSRIEQRPGSEVLRDILTPTCDLIRFCLESAETRTGTMELGFAGQFLASLRRLLIFAACGELQRRPFFPRPLKPAVQFADRCRIRSAAAGSFLVDVETPLVPPANPMQVQSHAYPLERLVLLSLMDALGLLQRALDSGQTQAIFSQPASRLNANLCEAILGMRPDSPVARLEVRVSWSLEWPVPENAPPTTVAFEGKAFEQIDAIGRALRTDGQPQRCRLRGRIIRLAASDPVCGDSGSLVATMQVETGNAPSRVDVSLLPEQYRLACDAHRDGRAVTATGILERDGRKWILFDLSDFDVVHEAVV
jgi:hypothetical protein